MIVNLAELRRQRTVGVGTGIRSRTSRPAEPTLIGTAEKASEGSAARAAIK